MEAFARQHLFALLIGINKYESNDIQSLRGAVADARAVAAYLQGKLRVPEDHITILENESATRVAILDELGRLANDPRIQRGDHILIFYAGHGSEAAAPPGWEAGGPNANIQLVLPYDVFWKSGGTGIDPIPDRTFGALIEAIAQKKGNNIFVVMDSCHSASVTRSYNNDSSDLVRSVPPPSDFQLRGSLDEAIWSLFPTNSGLRSHVLLSACGSSGQAWEFDGRGVLTVALLDLLKGSQVDKLRYCDIVMRMDIESNQSPHCEGFYRERYIFTTTSPPPIEYFIPAYTRAKENTSYEYVLNGGAAHGLVVGDEFAIYPEMDCAVSDGTLIVDKVGPLYSSMKLSVKGGRIPVGVNSVAVRVKEGMREPLRIHSRPEDKIFKILQDNAQDFSRFVIVPAVEQCNIDVQDDRAVCRLRTTTECTQHFRTVPTAEELARILKASWQFLSELGRTADFPDLTQHIQVDIYELQTSQSRFPDAPNAELLHWRAVPYRDDSFRLRQGASYGLKLTNKSPHDLYPIVQYFDPSNEFNFDTWYRPASSRSKLDVPLKKDGGSLAVGYGSGGSPPLVIPAREGLGFLKISLSTRPLDPFYDVLSFQKKPRAYDKVLWATIIKQVIHHPSETQSSLPGFQQRPEVFAIREPARPTITINANLQLGPYLFQKPSVPRSLVPYGLKKSVYFLDSDPRSPIEDGLWWLKSIKMADAPMLPKIYCPVPFT